MIERKQLDERTPTVTELIVTGLVWLVSLAAFAASVYGINQLDADPSTIFFILYRIVAAVSFFVAGATTYLVINGLARYLYYAKVRATLVLSTDRRSYRPGDDVRVSVSIDTDQSLYILSGRARLLWDSLDGDDVLSEVCLRPGQHLSPGESYESTVVLQLPSDANPAGWGISENPLKVDVSLKTSPRADAKVELVVLLELVVDLAARSAWLEWLEHKGCQPSLVWEDNLVDSRRISWISPGAIRCADGPVRYVEFRSMCREGHQEVLNEVRVHLEAS